MNSFVNHIYLCAFENAILPDLAAAICHWLCYNSYISYSVKVLNIDINIITLLHTTHTHTHSLNVVFNEHLLITLCSFDACNALALYEHKFMHHSFNKWLMECVAYLIALFQSKFCSYTLAHLIHWNLMCNS